jgi:hypothetical protein
VEAQDMLFREKPPGSWVEVIESESLIKDLDVCFGKEVRSNNARSMTKTLYKKSPGGQLHITIQCDSLFNGVYNAIPELRHLAFTWDEQTWIQLNERDAYGSDSLPSTDSPSGDY